MRQIEDLIAISRKFGQDSRFVIAGGGNTSYKDENRLWVKASGHALATITEDGFAVLDRTLLNEMGEKAYNEDTAIREEQVKNDLAVACVTKDRRPSVETSLHNCMGFAFVVHLHPTLVNGLMCSANAEAACGEIFPEALYIEYTDPGYTLFKKVYDRINAYKAANGKEPQVIFLQNHGIFVGGDTTAEIEGIYSEILGKLEAKVAALPEGGSEVSPTVTDVIPAIRQMLSRSGRGLKTLKVTKNALVDYFLDGSREKIAAPFTPDIIVYCKSAYIFIDAESDEEILKQAEEKIEAFAAEKGYTPKVLLIKGVGLVAVGDNFKNAQIITDVFTDAMKVAFYAQSFGGEHPMEKAWIDFIDNWEAELEALGEWKDREIKAIGEIGLDLYWSREFAAQQAEAFRRQLEMAHRADLPVIIHSRNAAEPLLDILKNCRLSGLRGVFHAYSGSLESWRELSRTGDWMVGIGGVLTFRKASIAETVKSIPLERIVLETDSPYLTPVPHRGERNESSYIPLIASALAGILGLPLEEVAATTSSNAEKLFGI